MLKEECGIMGVLGAKEASNLVYLGLYALQHRGQEACGIVSLNRDEKSLKYYDHKGFGLVSDVINRSAIDSLKGDLALGHVRYSTQGGKLLQNTQPFVFKTPAHGPIGIAHNGNLTNANDIKADLEKKGSIFTTTSDSEVFIHLLARSQKQSLEEKIKDMMGIVRGAYSLVLIAENKMYAIRDRHGFRPLVIGKKDESWVVASESCALDLIDACFVRDVEPGEVVCFKRGEISSFFAKKKLEKRSFCSFEPIYFSRPDSLVDNQSVYQLRRKMGEILAQESHVDADIVFAIPDSGVPVAIGYAEQSKLPMELALVRNHYVGRTFIEPTQQIRDFGVKLKLNPVSHLIKGKRVIIIDDSLVRGTTSIKIMRMIRQAGAKEIHFRLGCPPITHSCYYGVATPKRKNLLAAQKNTHEIKRILEADSLAFLSQEGLQQALSDVKKQSFCYACFNGSYEEPIFTQISKEATDPYGPGVFAC